MTVKGINKPVLSVAVCTYNRQQMLKDCLESLLEQTLSPQKYEILIIDNNSSDGTKDFVHKLQKNVRHTIRYAFVAKQGISHARNCAIDLAIAKYLAYLDDDEKVASNWCQTILEAFSKTQPHPDVVGGSVFPFYPQGKTCHFDDTIVTTGFFGEKSDFLDNLSLRPEYGFGVGNCAYRLELLKKYKGFNPLLGRKGKQKFAGEETELFMRMYADGVIFWYAASMIAYHHIPLSRTKLSFQFFQGIHEGMSYAIMEQRSITVRYIIKALLAIFSMPLRLLGFVVSKPRTFPRFLFRRLQKEGNHIGYFWQQCKRCIF